MWCVTISKHTYFKEIIETLLTTRQLVKECVQNLLKTANSAQGHNFTVSSNISHNISKILVHSSESVLVLRQRSGTKYGLEIHPSEITASMLHTSQKQANLKTKLYNTTMNYKLKFMLKLN